MLISYISKRLGLDVRRGSWIMETSLIEVKGFSIDQPKVRRFVDLAVRPTRCLVSFTLVNL